MKELIEALKNQCAYTILDSIIQQGYAKYRGLIDTDLS